MKNQLCESSKTLSGRAWSWAVYDFANSAYAFLVPTLLFPIYFKESLLEGAANADWYWGLVIGLTTLAVGVSAPFLGALADLRQIHRRILRLCTLVTCLGVSLLPFAKGNVTTTLLIFVIAHVSFGWAVTIYDSFLPSVSGVESVGLVSGLGWALGYLGGPLCLLLLITLGITIDQPSSSSFHWVFVIVGLYYFALAVPTLRLLPAAMGDEARIGKSAFARSAVRRVWRTIREVKGRKNLLTYLIAVYLLTDGVVTVIYFTGLYGRGTLGLGIRDIGIAMVLTQLVGVPACVCAGVLADKWGHRRVLMLCIVIWIGIIMSLAMISSQVEFFILAGVTGLVIGSTQAISRSLLVQLIPVRQSAEMFGFYASSTKVASILGPLLFGAVSVWSGSQRVALVALIPFFLAALVLLMLVRAPIAPCKSRAAL